MHIFAAQKFTFFLSYKKNTLQEHYNQVSRVNTSLKKKTLRSSIVTLYPSVKILK